MMSYLTNRLNDTNPSPVPAGPGPRQRANERNGISRRLRRSIERASLECEEGNLPHPKTYLLRAICFPMCEKSKVQADRVPCFSPLKVSICVSFSLHSDQASLFNSQCQNLKSIFQTHPSVYSKTMCVYIRRVRDLVFLLYARRPSGAQSCAENMVPHFTFPPQAFLLLSTFCHVCT